MVRHKADDCLREVVDRGQDIDHGEQGEHEELVAMKVAALLQKLGNVHSNYKYVFYLWVLLIVETLPDRVHLSNTVAKLHCIIIIISFSLSLMGCRQKRYRK